MKYLPASAPTVGTEEYKEMTDVAIDILYGDMPKGQWIKRFEDGFAARIGIKFALSCNSGSSANLLAVSALTAEELGDYRLKPGDKVVTTALCFPTTLNPILQNDLIPVFVDVDLPTLTPKQENFSDYKAFIFARPLGNDLPDYRFPAFSWFIEDNCDALGTGSSNGNIKTYSFHPAHMITTQEGGMVCTNSPILNKVMRSFRNWGSDCYCDIGQINACGNRFGNGYDHRYTYSHIGYNLNMTDMQAAMGIAQLKMLDSFIEKRRHNWQRLKVGLSDLQEYFILPEPTPMSNPAWFGFVLVLRKNLKLTRLDLLMCLESKGIGVRLLFAGNILRQPAYTNIPYEIIGNLDNTNLVHENGFWIGCHPKLTDDDIDYMIETLHEVVK